MQIPRTATRVCLFNGDEAQFESAIQKYNPRISHVPFGLSNPKKYALFENADIPYLLMVSRSADGPNRLGYNVMLSVTSDCQIRSDAVAQSFQNKTGLEFKPAPKVLDDLMQTLSTTYIMFKEYGSDVMNSLRR